MDTTFCLIPYRIALWIGKGIGLFGYLASSRYRMLTKHHIRTAFANELDEKEITRIARQVYMNLGMGLTEILSLPKIKKSLDRLIEIKGLETFDKALEEGKGVIAVTGHVGNWELLPMYFAYRGYSANVVARPIYYEKYNEWVMLLRRNMGVNVVFRNDSPKKILRLLKENKLVGIVADQDIDSIEGVFVDFFGNKAYTPSAPVKLAMASGAPIIPVFILRNKKGHVIIVEEPIKVKEQEDKQKAVADYTQKWSDVLQSYIRRHPEQWVWMHKRWKTRPT